MIVTTKNLFCGLVTALIVCTYFVTSVSAQDGNGETAKTKSSLRVTIAEDKRKPNRAADVIQNNRAVERTANRKGKGQAIIPYGSSVKPKPKPRPSISATGSSSKTKSTRSGGRRLTTASSVQRSGRIPKPRTSSVYQDRTTSRKSVATSSRVRGNANISQQTSRRAPAARPSAAQLARNKGAKNPSALISQTTWNAQTKPTASSGKKKKASTRRTTGKPNKRRRK